MEKKVCNLLGKGDGWDEVDGRPPGLLIGVNDACLRTPDIDVIFHMHDLEEFYREKKTHSSTKLLVNYCEKHPEMVVYSTRHWPRIKQSKEYPLEEIISYFKLPVPYFTNTPDYMIAWALWKGYNVFNFYGLNMTVKQEYMEQKPGLEFWIGMALGMGCEVNLQHRYTSLLKARDSKLYGYLIKQWKIY